MTKVIDQHIPPQYIDDGSWPLTVLDPLGPASGVTKRPSPGKPPTYENSVTWLWQCHMRWAKAVIDTFPGNDGHPSAAARLASIMDELRQNIFDPRFWEIITPSHRRNLTSYYECDPIPPGGPLSGPRSAWYWYPVGQTPPTPYDKTPGTITNNASGWGIAEYNCWQVYLFTAGDQICQGRYSPVAIVGNLQVSLWADNWATWTNWLTQISAEVRPSPTWQLSDFEFPGKRAGSFIKPAAKHPQADPSPYSKTLDLGLTLDPLWSMGWRSGTIPGFKTITLKIFNPWTLLPYIGNNLRQTRDFAPTLTAYQLKAP